MESPLYGTEWRLVALGGEQIAAADARARVTLQLFAEADTAAGHGGARASGRSGCNRYMGGVQIEGAAIAFSAIASTRMACPPPQMELEARYLAALAAATRWSMRDNALLLEGDGAALRFVAAV